MQQMNDPNVTKCDTRPIEARYPDLEGKVVVVTGAARGMGATFAQELARTGMNVVGADINAEDMHTTAKRINQELAGVQGAGRVVGQRMDVTVPEDHDALVRLAVDEFGRLDRWVNNAGLFPQAGLMDVTGQQIDSTYRVNVNGVFYGAQAAARHFSENGGGAIVNMASVASVRVRVTRSVYNSSKAAVKHLTNCMSVELGPLGVRVNAIAPGFIDTEMTRWVHEEPGALDRVLTTVPLRRIGAPVEVYGALAFLLSDASRYVNGCTIAVDGGSQHV
jgi:3-oxoacyl-[acyl-carrier protein] reductase